MDDLLLDSFVRLLDNVSTPAAVRRAEETGDAAEIQNAIDESGFLDALVAEEKGGAGLALTDMVPLFLAAGERLLPVPFAETIVARALIARAGGSAPSGQPILLWPATADGRLRSQAPPLGIQSALALVQQGETFSLVPTSIVAPSGDPFRMTTATPDLMAEPLFGFTAPGVDLLDWAVAITAGNMAGAMGRVLAMSLAHVNERQQFGRSLGKFQAIQQQLSVVAEKTVSAQVAARIGLSGAGIRPDRCRVAIAKSVANEAAEKSAAVAHAVHGAIGISEEHDLQLYTRRLKRWQVSFGSEAYWARHIGVARLAMVEGTSVDFVRARLADPAPAD